MVICTLDLTVHSTTVLWPLSQKSVLIHGPAKISDETSVDILQCSMICKTVNINDDANYFMSNKVNVCYLSASAGRKLFPPSSSVAAQNCWVHCWACGVKCYQETTAVCVESSDEWMSTVGVRWDNQPACDDTCWHASQSSNYMLIIN